MHIQQILAWSVTLMLSAPLSFAKPQEKSPPPAIPGQPQVSLWFAGTVKEAFEKAKQDNKPLFLYWGAVWCPPCNELKANIFSQARFAELMQAFIPVYLDGDTEEAQTWGEKLQISGYPTVLVLDASQKELFRLNSSVNLEEFEQVIKPLVGQSQNFAAASERVAQGKSLPSDWSVLAFADWDQLPSAEWSPLAKLQILDKAFRLVPASLRKERALLATHLLRAAAASHKQAEAKASVESAQKSAPEALNAVFAHPESIRASRMFINHEASALGPWLYPKPEGPGYAAVKERWLKAAAVVAEDKLASIDTRLWAVYPELAFHRLEQADAAVPPALKQKVQAAVKRADTEATEAFTRHAVISGAAYLLRQVADHDAARRLLLAEAARTDTPWYYFSSLAALEQELKRGEEAKKWAAKARESAQGRASKLQWITSDISLNAKLEGPTQKPYLLGVTQEFYELATSLSDGFAGRNRKRADLVKESLKSYRGEAEFVQLFGRYQKRCEQLQGENLSNCQQHFKELL